MNSASDNKVKDAMRHSWVYLLLPQSAWPYAQLARWERPIGWQLLLWPCIWGLFLAHIALKAQTAFFDVFLYAILFYAGAFLMRGAGCTFNDIVDVDIDQKVDRTRSRPLPSGRVSKRNAWIFLALQLFLGLAVLLMFNQTVVILGVASLVLVIIYPFMKRITWWPQFFLGLAFSWGALMGWAALMFNSMPFSFELLTPALFLYFGCIAWVIGYDTIYAHQDIEDDALIGVKSTARLFDKNTKIAIFILYGIAIILWAITLSLVKVQGPAWAAFIGVVLHLGWQVQTLKIEDGAYCLKLFKSNTLLGLILALGLAASHLAS